MTTAPDSEPGRTPPLPDRAVDAMLAEFNALRTEIIARSNAQSALVGVGLTAIGVVMGFVFKDDGQRQLLLAVPPLAMVVILLRLADSYHVIAMGAYIRDHLWPSVQHQVGPVPSWERQVVRRYRSRNPLLAVVLDGPAVGLFGLASLFSVLLARDAHVGLVVLGWACTTVSIGTPILLLVLDRIRGTSTWLYGDQSD